MAYEQRQIVKIGSQALFRKHDRIDINKINDLGEDVKILRDEQNIMSALVTSGAISLGKMAQSVHDLDDHIVEARIAASIGQVELMQLYKLSIGEEVAQLLLTHHSLSNGSNRNNIAKSLDVLMDKGVFPVINYNDTADDYELMHISNFCDNDKLTEELAIMMKVDRVVILSNVDGFMNDKGELIERITPADDFDLLKSYCDGKSNKGTGGMISKVNVGKNLIDNGIELVIGNSSYELADIVNGAVPRTVFSPA